MATTPTSLTSSWLAGWLTVALRVSRNDGRLYLEVPDELGRVALIRSSLALELVSNITEHPNSSLFEVTLPTGQQLLLPECDGIDGWPQW